MARDRTNRTAGRGRLGIGSASRVGRDPGSAGLRLPPTGQGRLYHTQSTAREASLVRRILAFLKQQPTTYCWKERGDAASVGRPDIMGCYNGHFFGIECKRPGEVPTVIQMATLEEIRHAKGWACWCDNFDEFVEWWNTKTGRPSWRSGF